MLPYILCSSARAPVAQLLRVIPLYHIIVRMKTVGVYNSLSNLIVASLSKPHTSRTALRMCVYVFLLAFLLAWLRAAILNLKQAHLDIPRRLSEHPQIVLCPAPCQ